MPTRTSVYITTETEEGLHRLGLTPTDALRQGVAALLRGAGPVTRIELRPDGTWRMYRSREGTTVVTVTPSQVEAARTLCERYAGKGESPPEAIRLIAEAGQ